VLGHIQQFPGVPTRQFPRTACPLCVPSMASSPRLSVMLHTQLSTRPAESRSFELSTVRPLLPVLSGKATTTPNLQVVVGPEIPQCGNSKQLIEVVGAWRSRHISMHQKSGASLEIFTPLWIGRQAALVVFLIASAWLLTLP
jgi:hypothetical protein